VEREFKLMTQIYSKMKLSFITKVELFESELKSRLSSDSRDRLFVRRLLVLYRFDSSTVSSFNAKTSENEVMSCYPGFLQIASFVNFRRLFREYSFHWKLLDDDCTLEFSHPCFVKFILDKQFHNL
jgi:hypothetical protein